MVRFIKIQGQIFQDMAFVLRARSTDTMKPVFNHVFVDDENVVCTDSRRLHFVKRTEIPGLEDGFYEVVKSNTSEICLEHVPEGNEPGTFPNYKQCLLAGKSFENLGTVSANSCIGISRAISDIYLKKPGLCVNLEFVIDVLGKRENEYEEYSVSFSGMLSPLLFKTDTRTAIVMPIASQR